jgi:hypothetical protein
VRQKSAATQPLSSLHVVAHALPFAHTYGVQKDVVEGLHVPSPLHANPVCVPLEQVVLPQPVPFA